MDANRTTPTYPQCSHCGEYLGLEHDSQRCSIITRALADHFIPGLIPSEAGWYIASLRRWLDDHHDPLTAMERQDRRDRETALDRWIEVVAGLNERTQ